MLKPFSHSIYISALLFFITLLGCKDSPTKSDNSTLRYSNGAEPQSINPHVSTDHPGIRIIGSLFEGLIHRYGDSLVPGIAKSWEMSQDGLIYTFHLRKSSWSDGSNLTAQDFVYSWKRLIDPKTGAQYASLLDVVKNGKEIINADLPADSLSVFSLNDTTLQVILRSPTPYFLHLCAFEALFPVPQKTLEKQGDQWTQPQYIVSNGPYLLKSWQPNQKMVLTKNPQYWDQEQVKIQTLEIYPIELQETAYKMYLNKELDWIFSIPLNRMSQAKNRSDYFNTTQYGVYYFVLNVTKPELKSADFRKALAYSIDRAKIVEHVTKGGEKVAGSLVPQLESIAYTPPTNSVRFDPVLAKKYLADAGFSASNPPPTLEIFYNTSEAHKKIAEVVAQMWKENLGVETRLLNNEWKIYLQTTRELKYQVARASWIADYPDPYSFLELFTSHNGNNRSGYKNPEYDRCIASTQEIQNSVQRFNTLAQCESILLRDMPFIPVYYYANNELRAPSIQGAKSSSMGMYSWKHIYLK